MTSAGSIANSSRTILVQPSQIGLDRTLPGTLLPEITQLPPKSSADVLDYTLDYSAWFAEDGDTLAGYSITGLSASESNTPLSVVKSWQTDATVSFVLSSGVPNTTYNFVVTIQTAAGYAYYQPVQITLKDIANATAPASFPALPNTLAAVVYVSENLPTEDPNNAGQLWVNGGYLMVSAG